MNTYQTPQVIVPRDTAMAQEPAKTVGEKYTTKQMLMYVVGAVVALLAIAGVNVPAGVPIQIEVLVTYGMPLALMLWAQVRTMVNARKQAETTREAVYAPATVADLVGEADHRADVTLRQARQTGNPSIV